MRKLVYAAGYAAVVDPQLEQHAQPFQLHFLDHGCWWPGQNGLHWPAHVAAGGGGGGGEGGGNNVTPPPWLPWQLTVTSVKAASPV
mmetsp:Transcript_34319/g.77834  ORF Transcript_34319/g.77834 Transcript_34319/m.77834 type:complete len:86 (+) Transcript_34319:273-530(+)|eukprot:CAMPEP_0181193880 /NCGR_PEP_ID=MMETSP1096-20121128/14049_1 /TAXON_ID=156174 ORGANISM="Chrysochromulina ericina, Strain CCMP281" /NCGR_SAMPLE_ID=MMETSP1096 /ASSEMBLY_ACC=CAM_ASM_000453 /LENGTH=85 /DNA_ID=CAMNT_0023283365 /DNA_START=548 /DNA_END=805 /DNA_ORIENTATION=+